MPIYCKRLIKLHSTNFVEADSDGIYVSFLKQQYDLKHIQPCYFYFSFNFSVEFK